MSECVSPVVSLLLIAAVASAAAAAPPTTRSETTDEQALIDQILAEQGEVVTQTRFFGGVRLSYPQLFSASFGVIRSRQIAAYSCISVCDYRGPILQIEPGLGGGQLSVGWARFMAGTGERFRPMFSRIYLAAGVKASLLRTWGDAPLNPPSQTFLGVEGEITTTQVNLSAGVFRRISDAPNADEWLVSVGLGYGF